MLQVINNSDLILLYIIQLSSIVHYAFVNRVILAYFQSVRSFTRWCHEGLHRRNKVSLQVLFSKIGGPPFTYRKVCHLLRQWAYCSKLRPQLLSPRAIANTLHESSSVRYHHHHLNYKRSFTS